MAVAPPTQVCQSLSTGNNASATATVATASPAGAVLVISVVISVALNATQPSSFTATDTQNNTYTAVGSPAFQSAANPATACQFLICSNAKALSTSDTITVSGGNTGNSLSFSVDYLTGAATSALDGSGVTGSGSTGTMNLNGVAAHANGIVLALYAYTGGTGATFAPGTGFTQQRFVKATGTNNRSIALMYSSVASDGTVTPTATDSGAGSPGWSGQSIALLPTAAAPPATRYDGANNFDGGGVAFDASSSNTPSTNTAAGFNSTTGLDVNIANAVTRGSWDERTFDASAIGKRYWALSFRFRLPSPLPQTANLGGTSAGIATVKNSTQATGTGQGHFDFFYNPSDGTLHWDLLAANFGQFPVVADTWYYVQAKGDFGSSTYTADITINGQPQTSIASSGVTPYNAHRFSFGSDAANQTYHYHVDDVQFAADTSPVAMLGIPPATANLTGTGTLSATSTPVIAQTAALTGSGTLSATAFPAVSAVLSGSGLLSATGTPMTSSTAAFSGTGALSASASVAGQVTPASFVGATICNDGSTAPSKNTTLTLPTCAAGDTLLILVQNVTTTRTLAIPSGWSVVTGPDLNGTAVATWVLKKTAVAGDSGAAVTIGFDATTYQTSVAVAVRNGGSVTLSSATTSATNSTTITGPAASAVAAGGMALTLLVTRSAGTTDATVTAPGWVDQGDAGATNTTSSFTYTASILTRTANTQANEAVGGATFTPARQANNYNAYTAVIEPASSSGTQSIPSVPAGMAGAGSLTATSAVPGPTVTAGLSGSGTLSATAAPPVLKPVISGLFDRQHPASSSNINAVSGTVVTAYWGDCEPSQGSYDFSTIESQISSAVSAGCTLITLRMYGSASVVGGSLGTPQWVMNATQQLNYTLSGSNYVSGPWWDVTFQQYRLNFEAALAAKYDQDPRLNGVYFTTSGVTFGAEWTTRPLQDSGNGAYFVSKGYTIAQDQAAVTNGVNKTHSLWPHTQLSTWLSVLFKGPNPDGSTNQDTNFTINTINQMRALRAGWFVGTNNADASGTDPNGVTTIARNAGSPLFFQTASAGNMANGISDLAQTLENLISFGAVGVELPAGYSSAYTTSQLADYNTRFKANVAKTIVTASLSGTGSLTATTKAIPVVSAAMTGSGSLTSTSTVTISTSAALSGSGSLSETQTVSTSTSATLTGSGALAATTSVSASASAALSGSGTLAETQVASTTATATLSGSGTLSATSKMLAVASAAMSASAGLASSTTMATAAVAGLNGNGSLTASLNNILSVMAGLSGTGYLAASTSSVTQSTSVALSGSGSLTATTAAGQSVQAAFGGSGLLASTSVPALRAVASLSGTGSLAATTSPSVGVIAASTGSGALTALLQSQFVVSAMNTATGSLTAQVVQNAIVQATIAAEGLLSASTERPLVLYTDANLDGFGHLTAHVDKVLVGITIWNGTVEVAAATSIWDGTTEVPISLTAV